MGGTDQSSLHSVLRHKFKFESLDGWIMSIFLPHASAPLPTRLIEHVRFPPCQALSQGAQLSFRPLGYRCPLTQVISQWGVAPKKNFFLLNRIRPPAAIDLAPPDHVIPIIVIIVHFVHSCQSHLSMHSSSYSLHICRYASPGRHTIHCGMSKV